jgi:hypothetical protein
MTEIMRDRTQTSKKPSRWRVFLVQLFLLHFGAYGVVTMFLFLINLMTGIMQPWFLFPAFGWGLFVGIHGVLVFLLLHVGVARGIASRAEQRNDPSYRPRRRSATEAEDLVVRGSRVLEQMRTDARSIPGMDARHKALETCRASEMVLLAIEDHPGEVSLARDFVHRFLEPAGKLIGDYARLARRNVPSAQATLREVEMNDFTRLTDRANAMFDRLHRGTLIDLEVAREMMALDVPDVDSSGMDRAGIRESA